MGDAVFHIVDKGDGEIEIVQLVQRFNCSTANIRNKSKLHKEVINSKCKKINKSQETSHAKDNCNCVMCQPILKECPTKLPIESEDETKKKFTKMCVRKNYSRTKIINDVKKMEANVTIINKSMSILSQDIEDNTISSSITIKTEPEIEIMDAQDESELSIEKETINLQETSTFNEMDVIKQQFEKLSKLQEKVRPDSTRKQLKSTIKSSTNKTLLELTTKNIKCNICGIEFPKSFNQLQTLKTHFMQHKTSTTRVIKKYTGVAYITDKRKSVEKREDLLITKPLILNKEVKRKGDLLNSLQFKKNPFIVSDEVPKLQQTFINLKKVPRSSLRNGGFVIGNTVIKSLRRTTNKSTKRDKIFGKDYVKQRCKAVDADDDIEIVEEKPELIVIDDNDDDDDAPKFNSKID